MTTKSKKEKDFDAVQMMRDARDTITRETEGMTFVELRTYIQTKLRDGGVMPTKKTDEDDKKDTNR